ncbi:cupin domain-containing protein [uncultured Oceanisphaera sp.]|uniref:cupin domain-containing protein n=1 Tax=uncultured Oceanisphaera sp. TaxID=353858 RepID=UPI00260938EE|nr:cupin domain-containing protein [uncultured Oceanisphaera sp.]
MNFSQPLSLNYDASRWQPSPAAGVWRYPLERQQAESGHVTSLVRFEPGARFPEHLHPMGEEFWVLEGTFSDENGDYPAGSYVRHPPGSRHGSFTREGCMIFVKLNQFDADDMRWLKVLPEQELWITGGQGYRRLPLHQHGGVHTSVLHFPDGGAFPPCCYRHGLEILVLEGELVEQTQAGEASQGPVHYSAFSWLRFPPDSRPHLKAGSGTRLWVRTGHLGAKTTD